jgi:ABC-type uncharacterized transport system YnjBCD substrate-binding protein
MVFATTCLYTNMMTLHVVFVTWSKGVIRTKKLSRRETIYTGAKFQTRDMQFVAIAYNFYKPGTGYNSAFSGFFFSIV